MEKLCPCRDTPGWSPQLFTEVGLFKIIQCRIVLQAWGESGDLCETRVCNPFLTPLLAQPTPFWAALQLGPLQLPDPGGPTGQI